MARIQGDDAVNITQSDVTSITLKTFLNYGTTATSTTSLTVSAVVFDALQTDARWTKDSTGYCFRFQIPSSVFDTGDSTYRCEFLFDMDSQPDLFVIFSVDTVEVLSS